MIVGYQHMMRAMVDGIEKQFGTGAALPVTLPLAMAYEEMGRLYRTMEERERALAAGEKA